MNLHEVIIKKRLKKKIKKNKKKETEFNHPYFLWGLIVTQALLKTGPGQRFIPKAQSRPGQGSDLCPGWLIW